MYNSEPKSLLKQDLSGMFMSDKPIGIFYSLGVTDLGHVHFYILNLPAAKTTLLKVDLSSKFEVVTNCTRYRLVTEIDVVVGAAFVAEYAKTTISPWYCLVNNSRYGHVGCSALKTGLVLPDSTDQNKQEEDANTLSNLDNFELVADSEYYGCLTLFNIKGDVCIVSTFFDDQKFSAVDLC